MAKDDFHESVDIEGNLFGADATPLGANQHVWDSALEEVGVGNPGMSDSHFPSGGFSTDSSPNAMRSDKSYNEMQMPGEGRERGARVIAANETSHELSISPDLAAVVESCPMPGMLVTRTGAPLSINSHFRNAFRPLDPYRLADMRRILAPLLPDCESALPKKDDTFASSVEAFIPLRFAKGEQGATRVFITPIQRSGAKNWIYSVFFEVKERAATTTEHQDRCDEDRLDRFRNAVIESLSHEIRTPLNLILGFSNLIADEKKSQQIHNPAEVIPILEIAGQTLIKKVDQLIAVSEMKAGTRICNKELLHVATRLEALLPRFEASAKEKGLDFHLLLESEDSVIEGDWEMINQAVSNILENAVKFTSKGFIFVKLLSHSSSVFFSVSDTGIGISADYLRNAGKPFSQEVSGLVRPYDGLGLGLALTAAYVDANGGTLSIASEKGKGTTVTAAFPLTGAVAGQRVHHANHRKDHGVNSPRKTVLVVEDDESTQRYMELLLSDTYNTLVAATAEHAFHLLEENLVHLVLMDLSLSGAEDGLDCTRKIRHHHGLNQIPIIAITAHAFPEDRTRSLEAGCDDYVSKPFHPFYLKELVSRFVSKQ